MPNKIRFIQMCAPIVGTIVPALLFSGPVSAEMIAPGEITSNLATDLSARPDLGGDVDAMRFIPFSLTDDQGGVFYVGQVMHNVVRDPETNTLSFYYRFVNAPSSSVLGIENLTTNGFEGYKTDVAILMNNTGETAPTEALRTADGAGVIFAFDAESSRVAPNGKSFTFLVKTNATSYEDGGNTDIRAFVAENTEQGSSIVAGGIAKIDTFRPTGTPITITPEPPATVPLPPAVWGAIPTMVGSLMYLRRSRRRLGNG